MNSPIFVEATLDAPGMTLEYLPVEGEEWISTFIPRPEMMDWSVDQVCEFCRRHLDLPKDQVIDVVWA